MKIRNRCPSCLGNSISLIYEEPFGGAGVRSYLQRHYEGRASTEAVEGDSFSLVRCDDCGLAFQKFVPDDALLNEIYNSWVAGSNLEREHRNYSLDEYRYLAEQVQFLIEHFECAPAELEVLDFGFGWGHWSRMAMGFGCNVWGTELSHERLNYGKSIGIHVVELEEMPEQKFHFINTEQVFEHLVEPRHVLERLVQSLSPNGLVKISVPDATSALKQLQRTREFAALPPQQQMPIAPLEHINSFDHASLVRLGESLGLKLIRPSFVRLLNSASGLLRPKHLARVVARPVYRHVFPRSTFVYFARA